MNVSQNAQDSLLVGTDISEELTGTLGQDLIVGLAGNDKISGDQGRDVVYGDFLNPNLLAGTEGLNNFNQYAQTGEWSVSQDANGYSTMTQSVMTQADEVYEVSFDMAANYASGATDASVEVSWNGTVIGTFDATSGSFSEQVLSITGTGDMGELSFRAVQSAAPTGPVIHTDAPAFYYEKTMVAGGAETTVKAFAEGQANIYQVINGTLQVFDPAAGTYTKAGSDATVVVNAIGYNIQDDLIYGLAVKNGSDSLGNTVSKGDLMMLDAGGDSYRIGETPYRSWTGDFDDKGNLWAFQSSMDQITMIDVNQVDAQGVVATQTFKFPKDMITDQLWDVAYDAGSQSFFGVTRPGSEGGQSLLYRIDISAVPDGGTPVFTTTEIVGTTIDGVLKAGVPAITFGAAIHDADGNLYVAGNSGDHDMDDSTGSSGGIYRVIRDGNVATLELVADAPRSYSNDGTADPRAMDPFTDTDTTSAVLLRDVTLSVTADGANTYDDDIVVGRGADFAHGGIGDDALQGQAGNDSLEGGAGSDMLYGGHSPSASTGQTTTVYYDEAGHRYDAYGNLLAEDNDTLDGGAGNDSLFGGSGHDTLDGGDGADRLNGGSGFDMLRGGDGDDVLAGGAQRDQLHGGAGSDALTGGTGDDHMFGDVGNDTLRGGEDDDTLDGGSGHDRLDGGKGADNLDGGQGDDVLIGNSGDDVMVDAQGDNSFEGGSGNDHMTGGSGIDQMVGGSGNDTLKGGEGRDVLKGGTGDDRLEGGNDKDKLYGGSGNDVILGEQGSDYINASHGDDIVYAGEGRDKIFLGKGADQAWGGADTDWFAFRGEDRDGSEDFIFDFTRDGIENDRLDFRLMNLLESGETKADWVADHLSQAADHSVSITLDNYVLTLIDHANQQNDFFDWVVDGLQL